MSLENPTPSPASDPDLLNEQAILCEFLDTIDSDDSDNDVVVSSAGVCSVCSNCKHPPKKGENLKRCSRCQFTCYSSEQCQRKDWDFHWFACSVVAKKSDTIYESLNSLPQEPVHICELSVFTVLQFSTFTFYNTD